MTVDEILAVFGDLADDLGTPPLWSNTVRLRLLREAQMEACRRARLLQDDDVDAVSLITVVAGTHTYDVDPRVIFIRRAKWSGSESPLQKVATIAMDRIYPGWESAADSGGTTYWVPVGDRRIRLWPTPNENGTLRLMVVREPLGPPTLEDLTLRGVSTLTQAGGLATAVLAAPSTLSTRSSIVISGANQAEYNGAHEVTVLSPSIVTFSVAEAAVSPATGTIRYTIAGKQVEIPERYHDKLVDWMLWRALSLRDKEEKYDAEGAKRHLDVFELEFGKRSAAIDEVWISRQHGYDQDEGIY